MNVYVNLVPKKKLIKKISILVIFAFLCFFIKNNVFASSTINLYDFIKNDEFDFNSCSLALDVYPDFLNKFGFPYTSNSCSLILKESKMSEFITRPMQNGYKYFVIYHRYSKDFTSDPDGNFDSSVIINMFKSIPKVIVENGVCVEYPLKPNYSNTCTYYTFTDYTGDVLQINTGQESSFYPYYNFPKQSIANSTIDTTTGNSVELYSFTSFSSNFDLYTIDGTLISPTTDIVYEEPVEDNSSWFEKIINGILDLPKNIANGIKSFFDTIVNALQSLGNFIVDGIKSLFIPGDELEDFFDEEYEYLKEQLGFLIYPIEVVVDFANRVYKLSDSTSAIFNIPKLEIFNKTIYEGTSFDLMSIVNKNESFKTIYNIYRVAISGFIVLWLVQLAVKKEHEIFGGGNE